LIAVMAQRLVRRVCPTCRIAYTPSLEEVRQLGMSSDRFEGETVYRAGPGCQDCKKTGYRGRTGIHELLVIDDEIRNLVMKNADSASIRRIATAKGMSTLREDGADKLVAGITTADEVLRVTQDEIV